MNVKKKRKRKLAKKTLSGRKTKFPRNDKYMLKVTQPFDNIYILGTRSISIVEYTYCIV